MNDGCSARSASATLSASSSCLVLITYVLASLLENRGWTAVLLTVATSATSVVALTSSHAKARLVRIALALSALTIALAAVGAASGNHDWLNLATLIQVSLLTWQWGQCCAAS